MTPDYTFEPSRLRWIDGARQAVKAVNDAGCFAFVVTNQSGVARGFYEESHVQALHRWMADDMAGSAPISTRSNIARIILTPPSNATAASAIGASRRPE